MAKTVIATAIAALKPFGVPIAEGLYRGEANEYFYIVLADDTLGDSGDDRPQAYVTFIHIHFVCPHDQPYADKRRRIRAALVDAGFVPPEVTDVSNLSEEVGTERVRHLVFETSIENEYDMEV